MADEEKPDGDVRDANGVTTDEEGNLEVTMETIEMSEGDDDSEED